VREDDVALGEERRGGREGRGEVRAVLGRRPALSLAEKGVPAERHDGQHDR
jgi:hypothetical protein